MYKQRVFFFKMPKQSIMRQKWNSQKILLNSFCVDHLQLVLGTTLRCGLYTLRFHWKMAKFSLASSYQLEIASRLGMGACVHFLS